MKCHFSFHFLNCDLIHSLPVISGNKKDLENIREVDFSEAQALAAHHNMMECLETSAKDATNIEQVFWRLGTELKRRQTGGPLLENGASSTINFNSKRVDGWGCCPSS